MVVMASAPMSPPSFSADVAVLLQAVVEASDIGLCVLDRERRILSWNQWLVQTSGVAGSDALGARIEGLFPELAGTHFMSIVEAALH